MRKIMLLDPFILNDNFKDAVVFAVIFDKKENKIKYIAIRKNNEGYFIYDEKYNLLFGEEYRPYFKRLISKISHKTHFIEVLKEAIKLLDLDKEVKS